MEKTIKVTDTNMESAKSWLYVLLGIITGASTTGSVEKAMFSL